MNSKAALPVVFKGITHFSKVSIWVVVNILVLFWIPIIIRHLIFRVPKRDHNFDNHPFVIVAVLRPTETVRIRTRLFSWELKCTVEGLELRLSKPRFLGRGDWVTYYIAPVWQLSV